MIRQSPAVHVCAALTLMLAPAVHADGIPTAGGDRPLPPSVHETDLRRWTVRIPVGGDPSAVTPHRRGMPGVERIPPREPAPRAGGGTGPAREVHGYHPYWLGNAYLNYDWSLLSTVAFFSLELDAAGTIVNDHGWPWTGLVAAAHGGGCRVIVTATLFSSSAIATLLGDPARRAAAVAGLTAAVTEGGADGVNVDFENVPGSRKQELVTFLHELRASLEAAVPSPYLSIATPAVDWNNAFDYDELAYASDHLMVMAYDYRWSGSPTTGPVAPLSGWGTYNVTWTVNDYRTWGAPPEKILLGVPWYGYRWPAQSSAAGAATTGGATARTFAQAIAEAEEHGLLRDPVSSVPWTRRQDGGWLQTWFDDGQSTGLKYDFVMDEELAGVGIWALGYDGTRPEMWNALALAFGTSTVPEVPAPGWFVSAPYPNPAGDVVHLDVRLDGTLPVRAGVYDAAGRLVRVILDGTLAAGHHEIAWNPDGVAPGVYFVRLGQGETAVRRKIVISR